MTAAAASRGRVFAGAIGAGLPAGLADLVASVDVRTSGTGPVVVGCDLDRTLIYSRAAADEARVPAEHLVVAEMFEGRPQSFWTADAKLMLAALTRVATFVPSTTRTPEQFDRVDLPGNVGYAVTANGGRLLVDGVACPQWDAHVREVLAEAAPLTDVVAHLQATTDESWVRKLRVADDLFTYMVVERDLIPATFVSDLAAWCAPRGWVVSVQGRKVYAVPAAMTKSAALLEVARRTGGELILAAGDSLLDIDLLDAADAGIRPAHGELQAANWSADHVTVTSVDGPLAGQEIVTWLLAHALAAQAD